MLSKSLKCRGGGGGHGVGSAFGLMVAPAKRVLGVGVRVKSALSFCKQLFVLTYDIINKFEQL